MIRFKTPNGGDVWIAAAHVVWVQAAGWPGLPEGRPPATWVYVGNALDDEPFTVRGEAADVAAVISDMLGCCDG